MGSFSLKTLAEFAIGGNAPGDEDPGRSQGFGCGKRLFEQVPHDGMLKACDEVKGGWVAGGERIVDRGACRRIGTGEERFASFFGLRSQVVKLDVAQDRGFDSGERKEEVGIERGDRCGLGALGARRSALEMGLGLDLSKREWDGAGVAVARERVDPRTAGIAEAEQLGDFVVGLACGVVDSAADERIGPGAIDGLSRVKVGMSARDDEGQASGLRVLRIGWAAARFSKCCFCESRIGIARRLGLLQQDSVDVAFEVVDGDERQVFCEGQRLGVGDADEQGAGQAGTGGDCDGVDVGKGDAGFGKGSANDRNDGAKVFAAGKFRNDSAIAGMGGDLRRDDRRQGACSALDDGSRGFVAGAFNAEDEAALAHTSSLSGLFR